MHRGARHRIAVHLEDEIVVDIAVRSRPRVRRTSSSLATPALVRARMARASLRLRLADGLILVGVDERTDALVGEDLGQQALLPHGRR